MLRAIGSVTFLALLMVGCGGGGGDSGSPPPPPPPLPATYTVGGTVSGLAGAGLVLRDNDGDDLAVAVDGAIAFPTKIASGATYSVTVFTQPTSPAQTCVITRGSGTMGSSDVTNVAVSCTSDGNGFTGFVSGPYRYTDISSIDASSGPVVYDGAGSYSGGYVLNTSGVISSGPISGSYTAAVGGAVTVHGYTGGVGADGNTIVSANLQAGNAPSVDVEIKQGQTNFSNSDFSGIYQVVSVTSSGDSGSSLTLTADGAGSYSGTLVQNNAGVITSSAVSGAYSVAGDGSLTITPASGSPLSGGISADGKTLVLSQLTAGQPSAFAVGIKQGQSNFTNADVVGTYNILNYTGSAELATLSFDGAGNINGTVTTNDAGTIAHSSVTGTYAVVADGTLTVTLIKPYVHPLFVTFTGGVSSDGNTLVLTYLQAGQSSATSVGVRL